jgi:hypothetical protein
VRKIRPDVGVDLSRIILTPRTSEKAYAYWEVPDTAKTAAKADGGTRHQLRIYDATDINLDQQPAHSVLVYDVEETDQDRFVPIPQAERDYVAEAGYETDSGEWLSLARSEPVRVPADWWPDLAGAGLGAAAVGAAALGVTGVSAASPATDTVIEDRPATVTRDVGDLSITDDDIPNVLPVAAAAATIVTVGPTTSGACAIQTLTLHSRHHAVLLDAQQIQHLQEHVAVAYTLEPGSYIIRIKDGAFSYGDPTHSGEPFVLLWIYGGKVTNLKTEVSVNATWSTLNGYADTLSLDVDEPAQLRAFFIDTFPENNLGEVVLSVVRL